MTAAELLALKERVEADRRQADRAAGQLQAELARLRAEHGVEDAAAGERLLARLQRKAQRLEAAAAKALRRYEKRFGKRVSE